MENKNKVGPPLWLVRIVEALIPWPIRNGLSALLESGYVSVFPWLLSVVRAILPAIPGMARNLFDGGRVGADICLLIIAFHTGDGFPGGIFIGLVTAALILAEAYIPPDDGLKRDIVMGVIIAAVIALSQTVLWLRASSHTLPASLLLRGTAMSICYISLWRTLMRLKTPPEHPHRTVIRMYRLTGLLNAEFGLAGLILLVTSLDAVPETFPGRNFLLAAVTPTLFTIAHRLQLNPIADGQRGRPWRPTEDRYQHDIFTKRQNLYRGTDSPWQVRLELLGFFLLALPLLTAAWKLLSGDLAAVDIDVRQVVANFAALITLAPVWLEIKRLNRKMSQTMEETLVKARVAGN